MVAETTADLVQKIIAVTPGADLAPFVQAAADAVADVCANSFAKNPRYTEGFVGSKREMLERWLAAHLYTIYDNQLKAAAAGSVQVSYETKIDYGLANSMYGQQVMYLLDSDGNFAKVNNSAKTKRKVKVSVAQVGNRRCYNLPSRDPSGQSTLPLPYGWWYGGWY